MAWSAAAAMLGNFGLNQLSGSINSSRAWKYAKKQMALEYKYQQRSLLESPKNARQGYVNAGYNPLLAIGAQTGSGVNASMPISDSDQGTEAVNSAIDAQRLRNENKLRKSQVDLNDSQKDLNTQQTYKTYADEMVSRNEADNIAVNSAKVAQDIENSKRLTDAQVRNLDSGTRFNNERARGFSASSSEHYGAGAFSLKGDYQKSHSKSW